MADAVQLALFDEDNNAEVEGTQVNWSYSRRLTLEQCVRKYYYEYYGSKVRQTVADPHKDDIQRLKPLSNCYLRSGEIFHLAISFYFTKPDSEKWLVDWARRVYRGDYEFSKSNGKVAVDNSKYPPTMLMEFHYDLPDAEKKFTETETRLIESLNSFLGSPAYSVVRRYAYDPRIMVEKKIRVQAQAFTATGKVDIAFPQSGQLVIVDWKTGSSESFADNLQLGFYALWGIEVQGYKLENIVLHRGQLASGTLQPVGLDEDILLRVKARILQDIERMAFLDEYGEKAMVEAFSPCSLSKVCRMCAYRGICPGFVA